LLYQSVDILNVQAACFGNTRNLNFCIAQADVRVEAAAGGSYGVSGNRIGLFQAVFRTVRGDAVFDGVIQLL